MNPKSGTPQTFEASFLPQQPVGRGEIGAHRKEPIALGMIVALVFFFVMLSAGGGVVLFKKNIERRIAAEKAELASMESRIDMVAIEKFDRLSKRVIAAEKLLSNHNAFTLALDVIAQGTAVNVGFSSLSFSMNGGRRSLELSGVAPSYQAVYFQGQAMRARTYVESAEIKSVALDQRTGVVNFQMSAVLKPDALRYGRYFEPVPDVFQKGDASAPKVVLPMDGSPTN